MIRLLALLLLAAPVAAQDRPDDADPVARTLVERARSNRDVVGRSITAYSAVVRERRAVRLRLPLRDRLLGSEETAARVRWTREEGSIVQMLGARERTGAGVRTDPDERVGPLFDPTSERLYFGFNAADSADADEEPWIAHPLAAGAERHYRYRSGDTITVRLPDGGSIRTVELHVAPRRPGFRYLTAVLWIEERTGALVQAVYRPSRALDLERDSVLDADDRDGLRWAPPLLRPMSADVESIVVQYSLWGMRHWLPHRMRVEAYARAGVVRVPVTAETTYEILSVEDDSDRRAGAADAELAAWGLAGTVPSDTVELDSGRTIRVFRPEDEATLLSSPELPPPVWDDVPGSGLEEEMAALTGVLDRTVPRHGVPEPVRFRLEWPPRAPGLMRYNRVEGLSLGARASAEAAFARAWATLRVGSADRHPGAEVGIALPRPRRTVAFEGYHRLAAADPGEGALGPGNSLGALLLGRDDGEYYRATGARVSITPRDADRPWYGWTLFAERQRAVARGTGWSVAEALGGDPHRPNLRAEDVDLAGVSLSLAPWWGLDPARPRGGLALLAEGAGGDRRFARGSATGRLVVPVAARWRLGAEAGVGGSIGDVPAQYAWFLGGPTTLRGYPASVRSGPAFARARGEISRGTAVGALSLFGDAAWAGESASPRPEDALYSVGLGASLLEGLVRVDVARALRAPAGWRLELYLDALL